MNRVGTASERVRLHEGMGRAYELLREWGKAQDSYEEMVASAREGEDGSAEWTALNRLASMSTDMAFEPGDEQLLVGVRRRAGSAPDGPGGEDPTKPLSRHSGPDLASSRDYAERALLLARELGDEERIARSTLGLGVLDVWAGRFGEAARLLDEVRPFYAASGDRQMEAECLGYTAAAYAMTGRPREGARLGSEAMRIGRELGRAFNVADSALSTTLGLLEAGDYGPVPAVIEEGLREARSLGNPAILFTNLWAATIAGRTMFALERARAACREMFGHVVIPEYRAVVYTELCALDALAGDWDAAHRWAVEEVETRGGLLLTCSDPCRHLLTEALLRGGDEALARADLERMGEEIESGRHRVVYLRMLAVLSRWNGETAEVIGQLREAEKLSEEIGLPGELWQIRAELGELYERRGESGEADRSLRRAGEIVRDLAGRIGDRALREAFSNAPPARRILERG